MVHVLVGRLGVQPSYRGSIPGKGREPGHGQGVTRPLCGSKSVLVSELNKLKKENNKWHKLQSWSSLFASCSKNFAGVGVVHCNTVVQRLTMDDNILFM